MNLFIHQLFTDPNYFFAMALLVTFSISFHEFSHAWMALRQGDPTAADAGHLTLNPLRQMGWMSLVMFAFVGIAWGQVPVNPANFRHKHSDFFVSFAGPAANLLLVVVFSALAAALAVFGPDTEEVIFPIKVLWTGAMLNVVLALFNLIPVPGFDGWNIFTSIFPRFYRPESSEFIKGAFFVVLMLLFLGIGYLFTVGQVAATLCTRIFIRIFQGFS